MEERLNHIFLRRTGIDFIKRSDLQDINLFGTKINLMERDAVYILLDIQKEFSVVIPKQKIIDKEFNSYLNIKKIVEELLTF